MSKTNFPSFFEKFKYIALEYAFVDVDQLSVGMDPIKL